jgi:hypothetical protein
MTRAIREAWDGKHAPAACRRVAGSADFHTKSWSQPISAYLPEGEEARG